jgi:hypothetical protein
MLPAASRVSAPALELTPPTGGAIQPFGATNVLSGAPNASRSGILATKISLVVGALGWPYVEPTTTTLVLLGTSAAAVTVSLPLPRPMSSVPVSPRTAFIVPSSL